MKKLLVLIAILVAVSITPLVVYAHAHGDDPGWRNHHDQEWRGHDQEWRDHDREWRDHPDRFWRAEHAARWGDWYRWHQDHAELNISGDGFDLDISF